MQMHPTRRISEAIGSWLHMEFFCYRAGLFSEDSLKAAVGAVLSSFPISVKGARAYANFPQEALNPIKKDGAKRRVDFALVLANKSLPKSGVEIAVETKWVGSSHCSPENIFQDFVRLACIKRFDPLATCIFVLAGNNKDVAMVLKGMPFKTSGRENKGIRTSGSDRRLKLDPLNFSHKGCFGTVITSLSSSGFTVPSSFVNRSHGLHPRQTEGNTVDFQAIAWEVREVSTQNANPSYW